MQNKSVNSKVIVKKSGISGKGLFATSDIKKGEVLFVVEGKLHEFEPEDDDWSMPHAISYAQNVWINPNPSNPLRYTNHSCDPNSIVTEGLKVTALKNIKSGSEITIDYSLTETEPESRMGKCRCGSAKCRGEIMPIQYLPASVIEANKKYLRKWIVDLYYKGKR